MNLPRLDFKPAVGEFSAEEADELAAGGLKLTFGQYEDIPYRFRLGIDSKSIEIIRKRSFLIT